MEYANGMSETYPVVCVNRSCAAAQIGWNTAGVAGEKPDLDEAVGTFHSIPASTDGVERGTVAGRGGRLNAASTVTVGVDIAIVDGRGTSHSTAGRHGTVSTGVQCHRVGRLIVNTLDPERSSASVRWWCVVPIS